ncbi:MAG: hypothetical protein J6F31_03645 [Oscillospiraceae bacterium]|nr:hypothetical protein [Oscillospiraceae bacterium]
MTNIADTMSHMAENLHDTGMTDEMVERCLTMAGSKRYKELEKLLSEYRQTLLDNIHKYSDRIDCLDFFTYTLRKNGGI